MRYNPLPPDFHAGRRRAFAATLPPGAVAIIDTNAELVRSRDTLMPFRPDSYFYYLTGIDQPGAVLVLTADEERLFILETDEKTRLWDGERYTREVASAWSGVPDVTWVSELAGYLAGLWAAKPAVYLNYSQPAADDAPYAPGARRARSLRRAGHTVQSARPALAQLRMMKSPAELVQLRQAIAITAAGFEQAATVLAPGRYEYELEAAFTAEFIRRGANGHAYDPIIAGGAAATVLHYIRNNKPLQNGELVLLDVGAEYGWYAADVTRVWPVGGQFTSRQHEVYQAVLAVQRAAIQLMKPGATLKAIEEQVGRLMTEQLIALGVLDRARTKAQDGHKLYRQYYAHGTSHFLGLDVHDVGDYLQPLAPGMVLTCEPGIYLPSEGIGVRLEDDILITPTGHENLTAIIPL